MLCHAIGDIFAYGRKEVAFFVSVVFAVLGFCVVFARSHFEILEYGIACARKAFYTIYENVFGTECAIGVELDCDVGVAVFLD